MAASGERNAAGAPRLRVSENVMRSLMPWSRKLAKPIVLKDGRTIATLADARAFVLSQTDQE
jgi:hypothetical protein